MASDNQAFQETVQEDGVAGWYRVCVCCEHMLIVCQPEHPNIGQLQHAWLRDRVRARIEGGNLVQVCFQEARRRQV